MGSESAHIHHYSRVMLRSDWWRLLFQFRLYLELVSELDRVMGGRLGVEISTISRSNTLRSSSSRVQVPISLRLRNLATLTIAWIDLWSLKFTRANSVEWFCRLLRNLPPLSTTPHGNGLRGCLISSALNGHNTANQPIRPGLAFLSFSSRRRNRFISAAEHLLLDSIPQDYLTSPNR